ncbi:MAG: hypothetical protein PHR78_06090 [Eubacteriales bacterium]|nr:hypothetical protein [Eubacteriales bacterium]MDD4541708.1 hypothetical protein [Eubacteriales bacterium]
MNLMFGSLPTEPEEKPEKKLNSAKVKKIVGLILWLSLFVSIAYAIYRIIITPADAVPPDTPRTQADYILMLVSCIAGLIVMDLPNFIEKKFEIIVPDGLTIAYFVFLYAGVFLGEVRNYFHLFPYWDVLLHSFSGAMLAVLGFKLISILNDWDRLDLHLSPFFIALFSFCFAVMIGVVWEIYEFTADSLLGMNMQKHSTEAGVPLVGQAALADTMEDFIINVLSALVISVAGFFSVRKKQRKYCEAIADGNGISTGEESSVQEIYGCNYPEEK